MQEATTRRGRCFWATDARHTNPLAEAGAWTGLLSSTCDYGGEADSVWWGPESRGDPEPSHSWKMPPEAEWGGVGTVVFFFLLSSFHHFSWIRFLKSHCQRSREMWFSGEGGRDQPGSKRQEPE